MRLERNIESSDNRGWHFTLEILEGTPMNQQKQSQPATLEENIQAYEARQEELEKYYKGKYVVFYNCEKIDSFDSFDAAAREAVRLFGAGPYLIRQVGQEKIHLSSSVLFTLAHKHASG